MSSNRSQVYLKDRRTEQLVEAELVDSIESNHLDDFERLWKTHASVQREQHGHWDWRKKLAYYSDQLSYQFFALECGGNSIEH